MSDWFPNATTVAHFNPRSQTIHLNNIRSNDLLADLAAGRIGSARSAVGTIFHELTHWADIVGTVWGRQYLQTLYRAYTILPDIQRSGSENDFSVFMDLHDRTRRIMHSEYFRVVDPKARPQSINEPWTFEISCGQEFDADGKLDISRPILFVRFDNHATGQRVARQPITAGALLEATAMHSEIETQGELISSLPDLMERRMELAFFKSEFEKQIYDPALTLYTAPVHILAHRTRLTDPAEAYEWAARVAFVALNMQPHHFAALRFPTSVSIWKGRFDGFRLSADPGVAYFMICESGGPKREAESIDGWLDRALKGLGLRSERKILAEAQLLLNSEPTSTVSMPFFAGYEYQKQLGNRLAQIRRNHGPALTLGRAQINDLTLLPPFDCDGALFGLTPAQFDIGQFDPLIAHDSEGDLHTWMMNFHGACR